MTKTALVTGAGSGIGRAVALRLAADGYRVMANDLYGDRAEAVAKEVEAAGGQALSYQGDVSEESSVAGIFEACRSVLGPVDCLVNNAGHAHQARLQDIAPEDFDRIFAVHVRGCFLTMREALPCMLAKGEGVIVNVASQLGQIGGVELVHYSGAKAAIIGMTKALAREVSAAGVRVNAIAPGPIETPLVAGLSPTWREAKAKELPLGRFGKPEEVAATVAFLASPEASLFVGQTLGPNSGDVML